MTPLWKPLSERKIFQWTVAYLVAGWGILQVIGYVAGLFGWPPAVQRGSFAVIAVGVAAAIVVAWYHGERGQQRVTATEGALLFIIALTAAATATLVVRHEPAALQNAVALNASVDSLSIAVLPFRNISSSKENEFFSDGVTEEILNALGEIQNLHVIGRTSAFAFRDRQEDPREVGRALGVMHLLLGSVQRVGSQVLISAKLINASNGEQMWGRSYTRDTKDVLAVEDEISHAIANQLKTRLVSNVQSTRSMDVGAHELYLLGMERWHHRTAASLHQAHDYFQRAIGIDSTFAQAYAGIALTCSVLPDFDRTLTALPYYKEGRTAAARALALDAGNAEAHAALGEIAMYLNDLPLAEREEREALRLNPNYATGQQWLAESLAFQGRLNEALAAIAKGLSLEPLAPILHADRGNILAGAGHTAEGMQELQRVLELNPELDFIRPNLYVLAIQEGKYDIARKAWVGGQHSAADSAAVIRLMKNIENPATRKTALMQHADSVATSNSFVAVQFYELAGDEDRAVAVASSIIGDPVLEVNMRMVVWKPQMSKLRNDPRLPQALLSKR